MDYKERYSEWISNLSDSDPLKAELLAIKDDDKEIQLLNIICRATGVDTLINAKGGEE